MKLRRSLLLSFLLCFAGFAFAQSPDADIAPRTVTQPTITFELSWPDASPSWYSISVSSDRAAVYSSRAKAESNQSQAKNEFQAKPQSNDAADEPLSVKFTVTESTRDRMFKLARATNFFEGNFEYRGNVAKTGKKTLRYQDGTKKSETTFNFSTNTDLMDLITMFQKISDTLEFGQRIEYKLRFDKLGMDAELKAMEKTYERGGLLETQAIAPILQRVLNDRTTMNITRARIQHILGEKGAQKQ